MFELSWLLLFSMTGMLAGLASGLLGVGGGIIIVPVLMISFTLADVEPLFLSHIAIGTSLAAICPGMISAAWSHYRRGMLLPEIVLPLCSGLVPGVLLGSLLAPLLSGMVLKLAVTLLLTLVALKMLSDWKPRPRDKHLNHLTVAASGGAIGSISSLTGVGGGGLMVPFMIWLNYPVHRAIGTSAACGSLVALSGALGYIYGGWNYSASLPYSSGFVYWPAVICITAFSIFSARLGVVLAHRLNSRLLRLCFAWLMLFAGWSAFFSDIIFS